MRLKVKEKEKAKKKMNEKAEISISIDNILHKQKNTPRNFSHKFNKPKIRASKK